MPIAKQQTTTRRRTSKKLFHLLPSLWCRFKSLRLFFVYLICIEAINLFLVLKTFYIPITQFYFEFSLLPSRARSLAWRTAQLRLFIFSSLGRRWKFLALLTRSFLKSVRSVINKFRLMRLREKGKGKKGKMLSTFCSAHNVSNRVWFH